MYVITHHHDYDEVLLGPIAWNPRYIASVLQSDLDLDQMPTVLASDESRVPYEILPNVRVRKAVTEYAELNSKIQRYEGPFWSYVNDEAIASFTAVDKPIDLVKGELKSETAAKRYQKENAGIKLTIQGTEVTCDTARGSRDIFLQKLLTMGQTETSNWKFPEAWINITYAELEYIVAQGTAHIQGCFDWEAAKNAEIDACTTLAQLDALVIE